MLASSRSPDLHKNTQLALTRHANYVLNYGFRDLDDTIVQVHGSKYQNSIVGDLSGTAS